MSAWARQCAAVLAVLALASCAPMPDDRAAPAVLAGDAVSGADTLDVDPLLATRADEEEPPGDGPLYRFADSTSQPRRWGLRDAGGTIVVPAQYAYASAMYGGRSAVAVQRDEGPIRWGYVDARGTTVIEPRFDAAGRFTAGRALVLLDDAFVFIDSTGAVIERLQSGGTDMASVGEFPEPCDSCNLRDYARRLARIGDPLPLYAHAVIGESYRVLEVQRHAGGVLAIAEGGWEHWALELRVPGMALDQGIALAKRIMGEGQYVERRDVEMPGTIILEGNEARSGAGYEEIRVRVRPGVVEIVHGGGV